MGKKGPMVLAAGQTKVLKHILNQFQKEELSEMLTTVDDETPIKHWNDLAKKLGLKDATLDPGDEVDDVEVQSGSDGEVAKGEMEVEVAIEIGRGPGRPAKRSKR